MGKNILITGGAGYLGSVLVPELLKMEYHVTVLDLFIYDQASLLDCCHEKHLKIIRGDCRDKEILQAALEGQDMIIPLAAIVGFPACDRDKTAAVSTNLEAIKTLLSLAAPEQKIIFPCTNSGYGMGQGEQYCDETSPIEPVSLYGKTKMEAERLILSRGNSVAFRFATLFGVSPRMRTDLLVNDFVYRAVNDRSLVVFEGDFVRNYLHVRDAARAFLFAIEHFEQMKGQTYNCGLSDSNLTKLELCEKIKAHVSDFEYIKAEYATDPDKRNYYVSNAKIESLGYQAQYSVDEGIEELIKAYAIIKKDSYGNN
ncbi:MAG: NAD(P)-dependent oxidoreductase [Ruminococcaceae bacterium]|nr:NAD(P)-dependent oxidoreductase [Oscillospiraceae bacterium]